MIFELYALACFFLPNILWQFCRRNEIKRQVGSFRHLLWAYVFMLYCFIAVYDAAGIGTLGDVLRIGRIVCSFHFVPFSSDGIMTYVLNVLMFVPFGFLMPLIWKPYRCMKHVALGGLVFSSCIEFFQIFSFRVVDIDDLLMNTIGAILGYLIWKVFSLLFPKAGTRAVMICRGEPFVYILLGMLGIFFLYHWTLLL